MEAPLQAIEYLVSQLPGGRELFQVVLEPDGAECLTFALGGRQYDLLLGGLRLDPRKPRLGGDVTIQ